MSFHGRFALAAAAIFVLLASRASGQTIGKTLKTETEKKPSYFVDFNKGELSGTEVDFFSDLSDGVLDSYDYYDAFLIASEVTDKGAFETYRAQLESMSKLAVTAMKEYAGGPQKVLAKQLLLYLHDSVFKTYGEKATLATDILAKGEFNCLSSAILYALIAVDLGLDVHGVAVQGHAFCQVVVTDTGKPEQVDVETTVRYGFEPGQKELDEMRNVIVSVPKKSYGRRENVPLNLLIAMLYANSISILDGGAASGEIDLSDMPRYKKGLYFDPTSNFFRTNLVACFNELALNEIAAKNFPDGEDYLKKAFVLDETHAGLKQNYKYLYNEWGIWFLNNNDYDGAIELFDKALQMFQGDPIFKKNILYSYNQKGLVFYEAKDISGAVKVAEEGLSRFPAEAALLNIIERIKVDFYNTGVAAFNAMRYADAEKLAREGLAIGVKTSSIDGKLAALRDAAAKAK